MLYQTVPQRIAKLRHAAKAGRVKCEWCDRDALWLLVDPTCHDGGIDRACADHASVYGAGMVWHDLFPPYGALLPEGGTARVVADALAGL